MKIAVLVDDYYQVLELWYPYLRLKEEGIEAIFVGAEKKEYKSKEGYPAKADLSIRDVKGADLNGVIIPGGYAPDMLRRHKAINDLVKEMSESGKLVAAICHAGWVLVSAGVVKNKNVTGFHAIKDDLVNAGGRYQDKEVVVDGSLITSRTPEDLPAFCKAILTFLRERR